MKSNIVKVAGIIIGLAFVFSLLPHSIATVEWSDDFNDGDYVGWTVTAGNWMVVSNGFYLASTYVSEAYNYDRIWHPSTQVVGTWSFNVSVVNNELAFVNILFMANGTDTYNPDPGEQYICDYAGYGVRLNYGDVYLFKQDGYHEDTTLLAAGYDVYDRDKEIGNSGWVHVDVTRNSTGAIYVYVNAADYNAEPDIIHVDTDYNYSERFVMNSYFYTGICFDEIVVDDEILFPRTTTPETTSETPTTPTTDGGTTPPPPMDPTLLIAGAGVVGVVVIVAVVFLRRR